MTNHKKPEYYYCQCPKAHKSKKKLFLVKNKLYCQNCAKKYLNPMPHLPDSTLKMIFGNRRN